MSLSKKILEFFDEHICAKIEKVKVIVDLIGRSMSYLDGPFFKKHFTEFVRAHLEYGQVMLGSNLQKKSKTKTKAKKKQININTLKNLQRCATKLVDGYKVLNNTTRLKRLDLSLLA